MTFDVKIVNCAVGALTGVSPVRPLFKIPTDALGGGMSVLEAQLVFGLAGTAGFHLVDLGEDGTAVGVNSGGTIATLASAVYVAQTPKEFTINTPFVDADHWVGLEEDGSGTVTATYLCSVSMALVQGK